MTAWKVRCTARVFTMTDTEGIAGPVSSNATDESSWWLLIDVGLFTYPILRAAASCL